MVIIIGAGITGLTLAHTLQHQGRAYQLLEANDQVGGYIQTERLGNYLIERGPNSYLLDQNTQDWLISLGLSDQILKANDVSKHRFIWRDGRYQALPQHPIKLLLSSYFSWATKLKIIRELWRTKSTTPKSTTIGQFFADRFGQEVVDYAVAPFVSGIYAGDVNHLLVWQTFERVVRLADEQGSLIKAFVKSQKGLGRRQSLTFKNGMDVLPKALAQHLDHLHLNHKVISLHHQAMATAGTKWEVTVKTPSGAAEVLQGDQVVLCLPAYLAAPLLASVAPTLADAAASINYPAMAAVHTAWYKKDIMHMPTGFGGLHPTAERRFTLGNIWTSQVFDDRCPTDQTLFTAFVGGTTAQQNAALPDDELVAKVVTEQQQAYGISATPIMTHIARWDKAIPQYDLYQQIAETAYNDLDKGLGLTIMANWLGGISLSDCINKGRQNLPPDQG